MTICILDTTVVTNIIPVPGRDQQRDTVIADLEKYLKQSVVLILPMAAIIETGNHIGQSRGDGQHRRKTGERFVDFVRKAIVGESPFIATPFVAPEDMLNWLNDFPDWSMRGTGFGDLSIKREFDRQCRLNPSRRVFIWSFDKHLAAYERAT